MQNTCIISGEGVIALSRITGFFKRKLVWYMLFCVLGSAAAGAGCGLFILNFAYDAIDTKYNNTEANEKQKAEHIEDLQQYIEDKDITVQNASDLAHWIHNNPYVYMTVYQNNCVIFNSESAYSVDVVAEDGNAEEDVAQIDAAELAPTVPADINQLYQITLADGTVASVDMFCYDYYKYLFYVQLIAVVFGILIFISLLFNLLQRRLSYIGEIEQELQILEGGNFEYPITIRGEDELGNLARGIEQMRLSILENRRKEQQMLQANKDLVTSMSHDLRTPLTTLNGYLEILNMRQDADPEKREKYLSLSLEKAKEIKELSDSLFEYFLIYGEDHKRIALNPVSCYVLVEDLIENQFLSLEEQGYRIENQNQITAEDGCCLVNAQYMQRVLNNIMSNLTKYADPEEPIVVAATRETGYLTIRVTNAIRKNLDEHESTRIGLITCERIMRLHHGAFRKYEESGHFTAELRIPMERRWNVTDHENM